MDANDLSLKLGPFTNELSVTVSKVFLFFCKQFLIWKMRNGFEMFPKFASSVNFPSLQSWQFSVFVNSAELKGLSEMPCGQFSKFRDPLWGGLCSIGQLSF